MENQRNTLEDAVLFYFDDLIQAHLKQIAEIKYYIQIV